MKLLHVTHSLDPNMGGVAQAIKSLVFSFEATSVLCEIVTLDTPGVKYLDSSKTPIHNLGPSGNFGNHSKILKPWLKANINRFDAIIIHGLWGYHSYAVWNVFKHVKAHKKNHSLRVFVMPHGMLDPYFQRAKHRWLKAIRNSIYWHLIEKNVINDANGLLFTCQTELLLARETFAAYQPKQEYNIGFGIEEPPSNHSGIQSDYIAEPYFLYLGRIDIKKGVDILVKAYISLFKTLRLKNEKPPKLVIAGPGLQTKFALDLQLEIGKVPEVENFIVFPGMLKGDAKWAAMYGCEAFILPSHQENFGIAVVEALACEKPVLISNQVNIWREIEAEGAGIVYEDTFAGIQQNLNTWLNLDDHCRKQMSENARLTYEKHFKINDAVENMIYVIK